MTTFPSTTFPTKSSGGSIREQSVTSSINPTCDGCSVVAAFSAEITFRDNPPATVESDVVTCVDICSYT